MSNSCSHFGSFLGVKGAFSILQKQCRTRIDDAGHYRDMAYGANNIGKTLLAISPSNRGKGCLERLHELRAQILALSWELDQRASKSESMMRKLTSGGFERAMRMIQPNILKPDLFLKSHLKKKKKRNSISFLFICPADNVFQRHSCPTCLIMLYYH